MSVTIDLSMLSRPQYEFLCDRHRHCGYGGSRGGGKSWAVRTKAKILASAWDGIKLLIVRRTYTELLNNHINPLLEELNGIARYNESKKTFTFPNGSTLKFGYCNCDRDLMQYQGAEYDVMFLDEATNLQEIWIKKINACVRGVNGFPKRTYSDVYADLKKMTRGIQQSREYMSQFDSEEAYQTAIRPSLWYQKYQGMDEKGLETAASQTQDKEEKAFIQSMAANARMERLRNLDETMTQTEIGRLKRQRDERMDAAAEDWTDAASREKARQAAKEEKQYNARIAQLETEITQARRAKQAQALGGVGDRTSEHYDPAFREGSQYRGDDMVSRIINETEQERAWRKQQDDTWGESVYSQRGYDRLSQQEKDTYNYWTGYDSRNGTQKAQEYLDSMQETLNARIAEDRYGDIADENRLMKLVSSSRYPAT